MSFDGPDRSRLLIQVVVCVGVWEYGGVGGSWHNPFPLPSSHTPILPYLSI